VRDLRSKKFGELTKAFDDLSSFNPASPAETKTEENLHHILANVGSKPIEQKIASCTTVDEVRDLWAQFSDQWTDEHTALAQAHITTLPAAS
jgi:hypothetical protein